MSVLVRIGNTTKQLPAESVTAIIATRFDGGDINVVLILDKDTQRHTYMATVRHPLIHFELMDIDTIGRVSGPVSVNASGSPIIATVQRGHVGTPNRF